MSRRLRYLSFLLAAGAVLSAQTTGALQGRVLDPKGQPVVGAKVTLTGPAFQGGRSVVTDDAGPIASACYRLAPAPSRPRRKG